MVPEMLRRELQMVRILSIEVMSDCATVEYAPPSRNMSAVLRREQVRGVPVTVVDDHAALLPVWSHELRDARGLVLVHVDRHSDLGMPNLLRVDGRVVDRFSGREVDPSDPGSIALAVDSTAIEIGSFLTLAIAWLPLETLVWVHPLGLVPTTKGTGLCLGWTGIDPLLSLERRLRAEPVCTEDFDVALHVCSDLDELPSIIAATGEGSIVLDIDLDYFDDSHEALDLHAPLPEGEPPNVDWLRRQDSVLDALLGAIPQERLKSVGIARSPGFCPAQVADALVERVRDRLARWRSAPRGLR